MKSNALHCILFLLAGVLLATPVMAQSLAINEVMSANVWCLEDEDGDYEDWIELYNSGSSTINLSGYGLSDDPDLPFRWILQIMESSIQLARRILSQSLIRLWKTLYGVDSNSLILK